MTFEERKEKSLKDEMLKLCKQQGYVPNGCVLPGQMVYSFVKKGEDICDGCNIDKDKCGGRNKRVVVPREGNQRFLSSNQVTKGIGDILKNEFN